MNRAIHARRLAVSLPGEPPPTLQELLSYSRGLHQSLRVPFAYINLSASAVANAVKCHLEEPSPFVGFGRNFAITTCGGLNAVRAII